MAKFSYTKVFRLIVEAKKSVETLRTYRGGGRFEIKWCLNLISKPFKKQKAWAYWAAIFVPMSIVSVLSIHAFGFRPVFAIICLILVCTLVYQRYVKRRTWASILWGEQG